jgi:centromere kinetochore component H (CENP-H)
MNHNNIKMLMAHSLGESGNYHRPTETQLLEDYLKAVDLLTINEENRLSKRINELKEKNIEQDYVIRGKLQEKDEQINQLIKKQEKFEKLIQSLVDIGQLKPLSQN